MNTTRIVAVAYFSFVAICLALVFFFGGSHDDQWIDPALLDDKFTYYDKVITYREVIELEQTNKELHTVMYNKPANGVLGSVWNTHEEAKAAAYAYGKEHGLYLSETPQPSS